MAAPGISTLLQEVLYNRPVHAPIYLKLYMYDQSLGLNYSTHRYTATVIAPPGDQQGYEDPFSAACSFN